MNKSSIYKSLIAAGLTSALALSGAYLVAPSEGEVLATYKDPVGIITSCYGHVDNKLKLGQKFTRDECIKVLANDLQSKELDLKRLVKVPYKSDYQHAALLSFTYNVGPNKLASSTLLKKLNAKDYDGACYELTRWVYGNKNGVLIKLNGLVTRRTQEYNWCMGTVPVDVRYAEGMLK